MKLSFQRVRDIVSVTAGALLIVGELLGWVLTSKQPNPTIVIGALGAMAGPAFWKKDRPEQ